MDSINFKIRNKVYLFTDTNLLATDVDLLSFKIRLYNESVSDFFFFYILRPQFSLISIFWLIFL